MQRNKLIESFFEYSDWNSIHDNFEFIESYILTVCQLFRDGSFDNLNILIKRSEHLCIWFKAHRFRNLKKLQNCFSNIRQFYHEFVIIG